MNEDEADKMMANAEKLVTRLLETLNKVPEAQEPGVAVMALVDGLLSVLSTEDCPDCRKKLVTLLEQYLQAGLQDLMQRPIGPAPGQHLH